MVVTRASAENHTGAHLALPMLNTASVKTGGTWEVLVWNPIEDKYEEASAGNQLSLLLGVSR